MKSMLIHENKVRILVKEKLLDMTGCRVFNERVASTFKTDLIRAALKGLSNEFKLISNP